MKYWKHIFIGIFLLVLLMSLMGCSPSNPVRYLTIIHTADGYPPDIIVPPNAVMPFPTEIHNLNLGDKTYIILEIKESFKGDYSSFKYTFLNTDTSQETELVFSIEQLFKPSGLPNYCFVPTEPGNYKFNVYYKDKLAAAALFKIISP
jgi:hypothetical protein